MAVDGFKSQGPEPIGSVLATWLKKLHLLSSDAADQVWQVWQECLGPEAAHTEFRGVRRRIAYFDVDSASLKAEIETYRKYDILTRFQSEIKKVFIRDIRLKISEAIGEEGRRLPSQE